MRIARTESNFFCLFTGAMEHWGLVTFRETALLFETVTSSTANKQRVASVIAHEVSHTKFVVLLINAVTDPLRLFCFQLAHMWFGNLGNYFNRFGNSQATFHFFFDFLSSSNDGLVG